MFRYLKVLREPHASIATAEGRDDPLSAPDKVDVDTLRVANRLTLLASLLVVLLYIVIRLSSLSGAVPILDSDSIVFLKMADLPLLDCGPSPHGLTISVGSCIIAGLRPPTVPLFYKLLGGNINAIVYAQLIVSMICWLVFAFTISGLIKTRPVRLLALCLLLAFSLDPNITRWDWIVRSESLSISLLALLIACWFRFLRDSSWAWVGIVSLVTLLWAFARETNVYTLVFLASSLIVGVAVYVRRTRNVWRYATLAALFAVLYAANDLSADIGQRWVFPVLNVLTQRVLVDTTHTQFFEVRGMPVSQPLLDMAGLWASSKDFALYNDPKLESFRLWMFEHGKGDYIQFLLSHPAVSVLKPPRDSQELLAPDVSGYGVAYPLPPVISQLSQIVYGQEPYMLALLVAIVLFTAWLAYRQRRLGLDRFVVASASLILLACLSALVVWDGDAMEIARHSVQYAILLRLGLWSALLFSVDALLAPVQRPIAQGA